MSSVALSVEDPLTELAGFLELPREAVAARVKPAQVVSLVDYHRRERARREVSRTLAKRLGVDDEVVFAACTPEGARLLLEALERQVPSAAS